MEVSTVKMEEMDSSEKSENFCETTRYYVLKQSIL